MPYIRKADREDIPALVDIARRSWLHAFGSFMPFEEIQYWARDDTNRKFIESSWRELFVPDVGGEAGGFVRVKDATIMELFVHPQHHRKGLGRNMLAFAEREIARGGHTAGIVECPERSVEAVAFYEAGGWSIARKYQGLWGYPDLWAVVLAKKLQKESA